MKWQAITISTKDLMLFEEVTEAWRSIADAYDYPMFLLGFKEGTTFSNVGEAKLSLYQDAIIPEAEIISAAFSADPDLGLPGLNQKVRIYYDHLPVFQRSDKEKWEAFKAMNDAFKIAYDSKAVPLETWQNAVNNYLE